MMCWMKHDEGRNEGVREVEARGCVEGFRLEGPLKHVYIRLVCSLLVTSRLNTYFCARSLMCRFFINNRKLGILKRLCNWALHWVLRVRFLRAIGLFFGRKIFALFSSNKSNQPARFEIED